MIQTLYSLIFFMIFMIYLLLGLFSITRVLDRRLLRVFLFICFSISLWALGFAISNALSSYEEALFWRRFSALGWGITFSFILNFILLLTKNKWLISYKWLFIPIYLPAIINITVFSLYSKIAASQYNLVLTDLGWGNIPLNNFWDTFYNIYYISFSLITLIVLIQWYKKSASQDTKKQGFNLIISFLASLILGSISEMLINSILTFKIPSIAPIWVLIPVITLYYSMVKHGFMTTPYRDNRVEEFSVLTNVTYLTYIKHFALVYFVGASLNLILYFIYPMELKTVLLYSTILVTVGSVIFIIPYLNLRKKIENLLLDVFISGTIPLLLLGILNTHATNLAWPIPLLFMMFTIIINNNRMLVLVAGTSLLSGIWLWIDSPEYLLTITPLEYPMRISFYIMCIGFAAYINKLYKAKSRENDQQVSFQKLISEISTKFISISNENFDQKITELLELCADFTFADRGYIGLCASGDKSVEIPYVWERIGAPFFNKDQLSVDISTSEWIKNQLLSDTIISMTSSELGSDDVEFEKQMMAQHNIESLLYVPITVKNVVTGFIGFEHTKGKLHQHEGDDALLKVLANIIGDAITKLESATELHNLAYYDLLTQLPNKILFNNRLEKAINLASRKNTQVGLIFIDLDGFKSVNDTLGHDSGDELLIQVAHRLQSCVRSSDTVARFGGDEFLVMVSQIGDKNTMDIIADKIMSTFQKPILVNEQEFFITASVGITLYPDDGEESATLLKHADLAMYYAKENGKGQYSYFSEDMKENIMRKMTITNSLYKALDNGEFEIYYQPQIDITDNRIVGLEALIRWNHPEMGLLLPNVFIPIAEQTGLINAIGEWVLMTVCIQNKNWQDSGFKALPISVNISISQFKSGNLNHFIQKCLDETGLEAKYIQLEITENIAMESSHYIIKALHDLKEMDISLTIDDFGTEYSSLSRLKDLPIDRLKIDSQFVHGISLSSKDDAIISVIIHLAKSLGLRVIGEGVETLIQLNYLKAEGCDEVSGYLYYPPMATTSIEEII